MPILVPWGWESFALPPSHFSLASGEDFCTDDLVVARRGGIEARSIDALALPARTDGAESFVVEAPTICRCRQNR